MAMGTDRLWELPHQTTILDDSNFAHRIQYYEPLSGLIDDAPSALDRLGGDVEAEVLLDRAGDEATHRVRLIELDPRY